VLKKRGDPSEDRDAPADQHDLPLAKIQVNHWRINQIPIN
jgi:hypothetical protein